MYIPRHFSIPLPVVHELVTRIDHGNLITSDESGPVGTLLPFHHRAGAGYGSLITHMSRVNPQWQTPYLGSVLVIADFADHYIDPQWAEGFLADPKVPTWNYLTVHAYGHMQIRDEPDWKLRAVTELCETQGFDLNQVPPAQVEKQLRAIVGVEIAIERVEAKAKLGQNLKPNDIADHIMGLVDTGSSQAAELADRMSEMSMPYAQRRWLDIAALKASRE